MSAGWTSVVEHDEVEALTGVGTRECLVVQLEGLCVPVEPATPPPRATSLSAFSFNVPPAQHRLPRPTNQPKKTKKGLRVVACLVAGCRLVGTPWQAWLPRASMGKQPPVCVLQSLPPLCQPGPPGAWVGAWDRLGTG